MLLSIPEAKYHTKIVFFNLNCLKLKIPNVGHFFPNDGQCVPNDGH